MLLSGLCKGSDLSFNTFVPHFRQHWSGYLKTLTLFRTANTNTFSTESSSKVHQLKYTSPGKVPPWHKLLPFKSWRNRAADKLKPAVAVLNLHGLIAADMGRGGGFGGRKSLNITSTRKLIEESFKTPRLEAVLLSINSPGGSPAQSELITDYIQLLAVEKNVKVYSFVQDVAASGGYWLACVGEQIYITENSVVGSIGVIAASFGFQDAIKYLNIERRVHTAGKRKLINDPFSPQKDEDLQITRRVLDKIHTNFKIHVTKYRGEKIKNQDLDNLFSGEYWVGREAIELGLADEVGTIDTFIRKEFGGTKNINVKEIKPPMSKLQAFFGASNDNFDQPYQNRAEQMFLMQMLQRTESLNLDSIPTMKYKI